MGEDAGEELRSHLELHVEEHHMPTCKSGIGSVLIEDYWKNKALTVVTSREPHGRIAHLNMQSQIVGPYTLKILHTEINNGESLTVLS